MSMLNTPPSGAPRYPWYRTRWVYIPLVLVALLAGIVFGISRCGSSRIAMPTNTPIPTRTATPTATAVEIALQLSTATPTATATETPTVAPTATLSPTATATETPLPLPTDTPTAVATATETPTAAPTAIVITGTIMADEVMVRAQPRTSEDSPIRGGVGKGQVYVLNGRTPSGAWVRLDIDSDVWIESKYLEISPGWEEVLEVVQQGEGGGADTPPLP